MEPLIYPNCAAVAEANISCQRFPAIKKRLKPGSLIAIISFMIIGLFYTIIIQAQPVAPVNPPTGGFNIEGTLKANTAVGDWTQGTGTGGYVLQQTAGVWGPLDAAKTSFIKDSFNSTTDLIFTGSSFGDNPNSWKWTTGKPTSKCDINTAIFHSTISQDLLNKWIILGGDRYTTTGTSYIDFQFSQGLFTRLPNGTFSSVAADSSSLAATNGRTPGDFVLSMEYSNGGVTAMVHYYVWEQVGSTYKFVEKPIPSPGGITSAFGATNGAATDVPYGAFGTNSYIAYAFVEAAVNIDAILSQENCSSAITIRSIFVSTKASDSYNAALKDFVDPQPVNFQFGNAGLEYGGPDFCKTGTLTPSVPASPNGTFTATPAGLSINSSTGVIDLAASTVGEYEVTYTPNSGLCLNPAKDSVKVRPIPALTPGTNPAVCRGVTSASLSYSAATGAPTKYSINFDATAEGAGFVDVSDANLPTSPITIVVPATAAAATYNGTLTLKTAYGCVSTDYAITVTVNPLPAANPASIELCETTQGGGTASFDLTSKNNTVTGGAAGVTVTWFSNSGLTSSIGTPGAYVSGSTTVYAKVTNNTTTCFSSAAVTLTVNPKPVITVSASPTNINLGTGTTSQLGINSISPGTSSDYDYNWSITDKPTGGNASLDNSTIANPVLTIEDPFVAGTYTVQVTATHKTTGCSNTATKDVLVSSPSAPDCLVTGPSPICPGSTNTYKYDPDNDNIANVIPADFTAVWTLESNTNGATFSGGDPGSVNSVSVVSGSGCGTAYTVKITLTSTSGLISTFCVKEVTVDDNTAPVFTFCPPDMVIECDVQTTPANTGGAATASDNCSSVVPGYSDVPNNIGCITVITRTWTATDDCGNTATCVQYITKRDRTAPEIICDGSNATATDNCSAPANITLFLNNGVWTAIDESGNVSTKVCPEEGGRSITSEQLQETNNVQNDEQRKEEASKVNLTSIPLSGIDVQAFPNPFNDRVRFVVSIPESGTASLEVYNMMGQKVRTVYRGYMAAGTRTFEISLPAQGIANLVYVFRLGDKQITGKLLQLNQ